MPKRRAAWLTLFALAACAHAPDDSAPRELGENEIKLDLTTGPEWKGRKGVLSPLREMYKGHEGWVDLHFMSDTSGKTYGDPGTQFELIQS